MHETTNHVLVLGVILRRVLLTAILGDKQKNVCLKGLCYRRDKKYWCYLNEDRITLSNDTVYTILLTFCNNLLQQTNIRMRSHGLWQLVDDKSVAGLLQVDCQTLLPTGLLQVVTKSCNKSV